MQERIVGFCGIVCTDCDAFIATQRNDTELKKKVAKAWSTKEETLRPEDIACDGCPATGQRLFKFCRVCEVRRCGYEKGVENCAHCSEFPCAKLSALWKSEGDTTLRATLEETRKNLRGHPPTKACTK